MSNCSWRLRVFLALVLLTINTDARDFDKADGTTADGILDEILNEEAKLLEDYTDAEIGESVEDGTPPDIPIGTEINAGKGINKNLTTWTLDERIKNAGQQNSTMTKSEENDAFTVDHPREMRWEGDIILDEEDWEQIKEYNNPNSRKRRTVAMVRKKKRWTNRVVPYEILPGYFSQKEVNEIYAAIKDWEKFTCLSFRPASTGNRVQFKGGSGCQSPIGMYGRGPQPITLGDYCRIKPLIIHEIGHALGLWHEQSRPDRRLHIHINKYNIQPGLEDQFLELSWNMVMRYNIPYDFFSIMHYGKGAFSKASNLVTIQTLDPRFQDIIGNNDDLSFRDIKTVNWMYFCREASRCTMKDDDCPGEGFVGKDCKCWCPPDNLKYTAKYCYSKPAAGLCRDKLQSSTCYQWALGGDCQKYPIYMNLNCKHTCNFCGVPKRKKSPSKSHKKDTCVNKKADCNKWAKLGYCTSGKFVNYVKANCKVSCGLCPCKDLKTKCSQWAQAGYCTHGQYINTLKTFCKQSCGLCGGVKVINKKPSVIASTKKPATIPPTKKPGPCKDLHRDCVSWANKGQCVTGSFVIWMKSNCERACGQCLGTKDVTQTLTPVATTKQPARNKSKTCQDQSTYCEEWARQGRCISTDHKADMSERCRMACGLCPCEDLHRDCVSWANKGHCLTGSFVNWMKSNCKKACGQCPCVDMKTKCPQWSKAGYCTQGKFVNALKQLCKSSCGLCGGTKATTRTYDATTSVMKPLTATSTSTHACTDKSGHCGTTNRPCTDGNGQCAAWASKGECDVNPTYMHKVCQLSCNKCEKAGYEATTNQPCTDGNNQCAAWASKGECDKNPSYMHRVCMLSCSTCQKDISSGYEATTNQPCTDGDNQCAAWASKGECDKNPSYMHRVCKLSCNKCHNEFSSGDMATTHQPCTDGNNQCAPWASKGECDANPSYMHRVCKRSCNKCH